MPGLAYDSHYLAGDLKIELATGGILWTISLGMGMKRWQFILMAALRALLFVGASMAMPVVSNCWTPGYEGAKQGSIGGTAPVPTKKRAFA